MTKPKDSITDWYAALEERHLRQLSFQEVRRAVQALSQIYVQKRDRLSTGAALGGAGKRAAFALFYGPIHLLFLRQVIEQLEVDASSIRSVLDLGCGTGVGAAAWALATQTTPQVTGVDINPWATGEALWNYRYFGLEAQTKKADASRALRSSSADLIISAYATNELSDPGRGELLKQLQSAAHKGSAVLIIEPIAKRQLPWWPQWCEALEALGGQAKEWSLHLDMPDRLALLDKASGLNHRMMKGRTLWVPGKKATA